MENHLEKVDLRLAHIAKHLDLEDSIDRKVYNIVHNAGNPIACAIGLSSHAKAKAMFAWFKNHSLKSFREWCFVAAKLDQMWYRMRDDTINPGARLLQLLNPLMSNNIEIIDWFKNNDSAYNMQRVESHKTHDFWAYQAIIALRGDWEKLAARCQMVLNDPPKASGEQKYLIDHEFYFALARADVGKMKEILAYLVSAKALRVRKDDESGYTADLISSYAVIYSKIALMHGYDVKFESPYLPLEWLDNDPLEKYDTHYSFLKP
jgi:hypothetical protein